MISALVSIIIPVHNGARFISETVESVLAQTFTDFELLIVDDGSTDGLNVIVNEFIARDPRIKYIHQENQGVSAARNTGFRSSGGRFIAFLDADDVWLCDNLQVKVERLQSEDTGLVHSDAIMIDEHSKIIGPTLSGMEGNLLDSFLSWDGTQVPGPSSVLMRREVLETVGVFDEDMSTAADKDLFIRVATSFKISRVDRITWYYRIHNDNMHKNLEVMERDVLRLYAKAHDAGLFKSKAFERKCFSAMYLILAASWAGDGKDSIRAFSLFINAVKKDPSVLVKVIPRLLKRWMRRSKLC